MSEKPMSKLGAYLTVACFAVVALVCLFLSFQNFQTHRRYPTEGKIAQAYPTSDHYTETRRRFFIKSYDTDLAFEDESGNTIRLAKNNISSEELAILQQGQTIAREYLPEDPSGTARRPNDMMGIWVPLLIAAIAAFVGWGYWPSKNDDNGQTALPESENQA